MPPPPNDPHGGHQDPYGGYQGYQDSYGGHQDPYGGYQPAPQPRYRDNRGDGVRQDRIALVVHTIADIAAGFLALWILLYLLDANQANVFVDFVRGVATWLSGWSQDIFTMKTEGVRVLLNFGLPALIYLGIGHGVAAWVRRL
jgi:hypothetical protein